MTVSISLFWLLILIFTINGIIDIIMTCKFKDSFDDDTLFFLTMGFVIKALIIGFILRTIL